jgi:peptide chain release factor subunit 1
MAKSLLIDRLDTLARLESPPSPVLSLYLNTDVDGTGRPTYDLFVRKEVAGRLKTYPEHSQDRKSLERDAERLDAYLTRDLMPSTRGLAIFACEGAELFEGLALEVPFDRNQLVIADHPHLYPLARLHDQYPRYAALVVDTNAARIFVFSTGATEESLHLQHPKTKHTKVGGWSQARYQRHVENARLLHAKDVIERLDALVAAEGIAHVVIAGDEVIVPVLNEQLPERLRAKLVDVLRLDMRTPEHQVLTATLDALRRSDVATDEAVVRDVIDSYRAGGLGVVGVEKTRKALERGQVDTLVISATPAQVDGGEATADALVTLARQTSALIRFVENPALLGRVDGVAARLRYLGE